MSSFFSNFFMFFSQIFQVFLFFFKLSSKKFKFCKHALFSHLHPTGARIFCPVAPKNYINLKFVRFWCILKIDAIYVLSRTLPWYMPYVGAETPSPTVLLGLFWALGRPSFLLSSTQKWSYIVKYHTFNPNPTVVNQCEFWKIYVFLKNVFFIFFISNDHMVLYFFCLKIHQI